MCSSSRVPVLKLVIDNTKTSPANDRLLAKAVNAYWRACETEAPQADHAIEFLGPIKAGSPRGLAQKAQILENMVETCRSPEQIAGFAACLADDALNVSRLYLARMI